MPTLPLRPLRRRTRWVALGAVWLGGAACFGPGGHATAPSPSAAWTPPPEAQRKALPAPAAAPPPDLAQRLAKLQLADVLDLALRNNTATAAAWEDARAAAQEYAVARAAVFPTLTLDGNFTVLKTASTQGRQAVRQTIYGPQLNLNWLLLDLGGRSGATSAAHAQMVAADWTHNAVLQSVVLTVEQAFFSYVGTRALLAAQQASLAEADTNLQAAVQRHDVGVATIAEVLQARTARSQALLNLETTQGALQTARGALAVSMGYPANLPYDIDSLPFEARVSGLAEDVDSLIVRAVAARPDLAAARSDVDAARARVSSARGAALPSLLVTGVFGETYLANQPAVPGSSYTLNFGVQVPLFAGGAHLAEIHAAEAQAEAANQRANGFTQQVIYQVFTSYYAFQTAAQSARTADDLLASARQSAQVALGRYKAGAGSLLDLLTAQAALAQARAQQINAHFGWYIAFAQLAHDVGVLGLDGSIPIRLQPDSSGGQ